MIMRSGWPASSWTDVSKARYGSETVWSDGSTAMPDKTHLVMRAFELAPQCSNLKDLHKLLREDGYTSRSIESHLAGLGMRRELKQRYNGGTGAKRTGPKR